MFHWASSLDRRACLGQFSRRLPRGEGALQEVEPFVELLELLPKPMSSRVVRGHRAPTLYSLRERRGDRTQDPDEYPAGGDEATKVDYREFVHGSPLPCRCCCPTKCESAARDL